MVRPDLQTIRAAISASRRLGRKRSAIRLRIRRRVKRCGSTRSSKRGPTITAIPRTPWVPTRCSMTSASIGSRTLPLRLLASTGRIPAPARQGSPKGGSSCRWRRRFSRTRYSGRRKPGPRRSGRTCSIGMSSTKVGISPRSSNRRSSPKRCERPSGHSRSNAPMSNQRRQFLGIAAGAIAVPATAGTLVAQRETSRATEARMPAQASVPERRPGRSDFTGLPALMTPEECVVVLIDHQPFQIANLHSHEPTMVVNNVIGLAKFAKAFKVPVILTTVLEARRVRMIKGLRDVFPDQKPIDRTYINTWQDKRVVDLVKGTGRRKLILAALWTEMCLAMPAIHALGEGYDVYIVTDASGGVSMEAHDMAVRRMVQAGAVPITWLALSGEWQRDLAREATLAESAKILSEHGGGSGVAFAWEMQLLGGSKP